MAIDLVNIGAAPNDGTGDDLRTAFKRINNNFGNVILANTAVVFSDIQVTNTTAAISQNSGALIVAGGVGIGGNLFAANLNITGTAVIGGTNIADVISIVNTFSSQVTSAENHVNLVSAHLDNMSQAVSVTRCYYFV